MPCFNYVGIMINMKCPLDHLHIEHLLLNVVKLRGDILRSDWIMRTDFINGWVDC